MWRIHLVIPAVLLHFSLWLQVQQAGSRDAGQDVVEPPHHTRHVHQDDGEHHQDAGQPAQEEEAHHQGGFR